MGMTADDWDDRYRTREYVWTVTPNRFVVEQVEALQAELAATGTRGSRRALDLACGEGRNAVWLALQGWDVTGVDHSAEGLAKAAALAEHNDASVEWVQADATTWSAQRPYDLVVVAYLQLPAEQRRAALGAAFDSLRAGGTVVVVARDSANLTDGTGGPQDPAHLYTPADVVADLRAAAGSNVQGGAQGGAVVVEVADTLERPVDGADRPALDAVVRARRVQLVEVFADVGCPFTHLGLVHFVEARAAAGRERDVLLDVRAWPLEIVNATPLDPGFIAEEVDEIRGQAARDCFAGFREDAFPATSLPAMALAAAARRTDPVVSEAVSLELRRLLFEDGVDIADPEVLDAVAARHELVVGDADVEAVLADHAEGVERGVMGSPHFFTGGGGDFFCPALDVSRGADGHLRITTDPEGFAAFLAAALT